MENIYLEGWRVVKHQVVKDELKRNVCLKTWHILVKFILVKD